MAEGLLRARFGERYLAFSAGVSPTFVDPDAIRVMAEIGIDISGQRSKGLEEVRDIGFDMVVTVCDNARESCPFFPGAGIQIHKSFEDPASFQGDDPAPGIQAHPG